MSCRLSILLIAVVAVPWLLYGVRQSFQFAAYCKRVAELTDRKADLESFWGVDDGGMNRFQREQIGRLLSRDYAKLGDERLTAMGDSLRRRWPYGFLVSGLIIVAIVVAHQTACA